MPIKVLIPTPLRPYAGKQSVIEVSALTVGEALNNLIAQHPDLRKHLYSEEGKLRSFVNVYLNDEDIRYLSKEATEVKDSDTIAIVPSVAGGHCGIRAPIETKANRGIGDEEWEHRMKAR